MLYLAVEIIIGGLVGFGALYIMHRYRHQLRRWGIKNFLPKDDPLRKLYEDDDKN